MTRRLIYLFYIDICWWINKTMKKSPFYSTVCRDYKISFRRTPGAHPIVWLAIDCTMYLERIHSSIWAPVLFCIDIDERVLLIYCTNIWLQSIMYIYESNNIFGVVYAITSPHQASMFKSFYMFMFIHSIFVFIVRMCWLFIRGKHVVYMCAQRVPSDFWHIFLRHK